MCVTTTPIPATPKTPLENAQCDKCWMEHAVYGTAVPVARRDAAHEFAYCTLCGQSDLRDDRSPFEALRSADAWLAECPEGDWDRKMVRTNYFERIKAIALTADPTHCSDCTTQARLAAPILAGRVS